MSGKDPKTDPKTEQLRLHYAFWLSLGGLLIAALLVIFLIQIKDQWLSSDIVAVVGLFTSILGTLVGAFFGFNIGAAGRDEERQMIRDANALAQRALAALPPDIAKDVLEKG